MQTEDFKIEEVADNLDTTFKAEPFRITEYKVNSPSFSDFMDLSIRHSELKNYTVELEETQRTLGEDLKENKRLDTINQRNVKNVESAEGRTNTYTWAFGGLTIGIRAVGALATVLLCLNKQKAQKGMRVTVNSPPNPPTHDHEEGSS